MKNNLQKTLLISALSSLFCGTLAHAEDARPDNEFSFNAAATSDYRYRGISQTRLQPALQGGVDYTHNPDGLYAGAWASTIKWIKDAGGSSDLELDLYAGKRGEIVKNISYDVGVLTYVYPSNGLAVNANTTEIYGQIGYGPGYAKYSHAVTNLFAYADSKNSGYLDLGANLDIDTGLVLNLHVGRQNVKSNPAATYTDWKVGATKEIWAVNWAIAIIGTNADRLTYASPVNAKFMGKTAVVVSISKIF
ncbi:TorF family putative porin [Undibacterium sp. Jales W-56]|uniref:TorF family putative porin n=1 Tax=Undibacterium sp. Jales W-56 TaxID=2897325 RepID=UPI0021D3CB2A|nr:TorF family putative porin [Undibacterium sp. Jales W-56]MCU6433525.1 TorF family putative porin [Undibacterium sp. Jales W-56]